ncbi:uncharacterized protein LOC119678176 [Teleopsis dalmanni]|uniref:uncharacterized protein LOC119678176 n=1 Tax=Teleopsis dalmanni TaxID=139649 RepID=UPI0018CF6042|nr:uncharacterized protein LOC119678176 [Teleopsis dalmanni]
MRAFYLLLVTILAAPALLSAHGGYRHHITSNQHPVAYNAPNCALYTNGAYIPDTLNCARYYVCVNSRAVLNQCPSGSNFDTITYRCKSASLVNCDLNRNPVTSAPQTDSTTECTTTSCTTTSSTTTATPPDNVLRILRSVTDCMSLDDGTNLLDAHHCRRYYVCSGGAVKLRKCQSGQWFDYKLAECRTSNLVSNCPAQHN